ncbi:hypothetical protein HKD37_07G019206 [Glycine soja]
MNSQHRGHIELYPLVMGVVVAAYHAVEVLTGAKGISGSLLGLEEAVGAMALEEGKEKIEKFTRLESVQIKFEDEVKALILLSSLPDSWVATVTAVSSSTRENTLKVSDIHDLILSEDIRKRDSGESSR